MRGGAAGSAFGLVTARLDLNVWPLFDRTRRRREFGRGSRIGFYVAGKRIHGGEIVAAAIVKEVTAHRSGAAALDPEQFLTDRPVTVLHLENITYLKEPIDFASAISDLELCPNNKKNWGSVLQGGVTALSRHDWENLFGR